MNVRLLGPGGGWCLATGDHVQDGVGQVTWLVVLTFFKHLEKYESQLGLPFPIYGKIINIPNHQPVTYEITIWRFP